MNMLTDEQLVMEYLANKDEQSLGELVNRYLHLIFGFVKKYTGNEGDASDITQEVFIKVWKNIKSFDQSRSFRTWIFTIAKRTAIDELRKKKALPFYALGEEFDFSETLVDESPSSLDKILSKQQSEELAVALGKLPANYRSVIKLYNYDSLNFREIASKLEEPLNTVKSRYRRGLILLKDII
jgi:RNA polymerase sigma-70 factor (ECF subfamily)